MEPVTTGKRLSEEEALILYSACYLHDLGMHYEKVGDTSTIQGLQLGQRWEDLAEGTRREHLRRHHHEISAELVHAAAQGDGQILDLTTGPRRVLDYVAALCEAHGADTGSGRYQELVQASGALRIGLLCSLLRIADILDESHRRANPDVRNCLSLTLQEQVHWWRHYYVEDVVFDPPQNAIRIEFDFPPDKRDEYAKIVPELQVPTIEQEFQRHTRELTNAGLRWIIEKKVLQKPFSAASHLPDEVLFAMLRELHDAKLLQAQRDKQLVLQSFEEAQPYLKRRIDELQAGKDQLAARDYLLKLQSIARDFAEIGARMQAWQLLWHDFSTSGSSLKPQEQLQMGMWLASLMLHDQHPELAAKVLREMEGCVGNVDALVRAEYYRIGSHAMIEDCQFNDALQSALRSISLFAGHPSARELEAEVDEWHYLQGIPLPQITGDSPHA